ncbi:hypothetical protein TWF481_000549 [Arthrobotrys musiformis]|uniref:Uncharacterized protein n=1 Tax=Arthrobotrys musiformis TaxID=47236 RepID=A0AAV9WQ67_9PEZI
MLLTQPLARPRVGAPRMMNSASPWVFDKAQAFPWGYTKLSLPNGKIIDTKPKEPTPGRQRQPSPLTIVPIEQFRIVGLLASDTRNLFPDENKGYWEESLKPCKEFERKATQPWMKNIRYLPEYYHGQSEILKGVASALLRSINGYYKKYNELGDERTQDRGFSHVQTSVWGLTCHIERLQELQTIFFSKANDFRRFHYIFTSLKSTSNYPPLLGVLRAGACAFFIAGLLRYLVGELTELRKFMNENLAAPSQQTQEFFTRRAAYNMQENLTCSDMLSVSLSSFESEPPQHAHQEQAMQLPI